MLEPAWSSTEESIFSKLRSAWGAIRGSDNSEYSAFWTVAPDSTILFGSVNNVIVPSDDVYAF